MLHVVPIEPLEERYSKQWLEWTRSFLREKQKENENFLYQIFNPPRSYSLIRHGAFLDVVGTNLHKNMQMKKILQYVQCGHDLCDDVFWFHDMWFPGLEMLAYVRDAFNLKFKIYGMLHAGTYDPHDFLTKCGMREWGYWLEESWMRIVDGVFVATDFHKDLLSRNFTGGLEKIHVTGFPIFHTEQMRQKGYDVPWHQRDNIVVFPHRFDDEKQPELCVPLYEALQREIITNGYRVLLTKKECETKDEYYKLLCRAKFAVSFAKQETFGIAQKEAVLCGCIPIVPDRLAYTEAYPELFRYQNTGQDVDGAYECILNILTKDVRDIQEKIWNLQSVILEQGGLAFKHMLSIMTQDSYRKDGYEK